MRRALVLIGLLLAVVLLAGWPSSVNLGGNGTGGGTGGGGGGAFTFVDSASGADDAGGTNSVSTAGDPLNVADGDLLIAVVTWEDGGATISSFTDGGSNTLAVDGAEYFNDPATFINGAPAYRAVGVGNASATFTATLSANRAFKKLVVMQYRPASGETASKDISGTREADGSGTAITTGSFSTTGTDGVVCGMTGIYTSGSHSGSTIAGVAADQTRQEGGAFAWCRITTAALTTQTASTTYSASNTWAASVLAFKAE